MKTIDAPSETSSAGHHRHDQSDLTEQWVDQYADAPFRCPIARVRNADVAEELE